MEALSISEKILFFICGFGVLQGLILACLIFFHPKCERSVNIFLSFYILCTSLVISIPFYIKVIGWQNSYIIQPIPLLTGPLLYLYLRSFKENITWRKVLPHLLLPVLYMAFIYSNVFYYGHKYVGLKDVPAELLQKPRTIILQFIKPAQQIVYFFAARKVLLSYRRSINQLFSDTSRFDLNWARYLLYGFLILVLCFVVIFPLILRFPQKFDLLLLINMGIATPYIYIATYKGMQQLTIWQIQPEINKTSVVHEMEEAEQVADKENQKSIPVRAGLSRERIEELSRRITHLMEGEKLFQETELTLQQLANKLQVPAYQVSQALNEGMGKNFYDLVNGYRVKEAKTLLMDSKNRNYTILSVGFEAGFNSKTTFNTVFKKFTGLTPTEFKNQDKSALALV